MLCRNAVFWMASLIVGALPIQWVAMAQAQRVPTRDSDHVVRTYPWSWQELQQRNVVMQAREYSCGAAALATVTRYYWGDDTGEQIFLDALDKLLTEAEIKDRIQNGLTMTDLKRVAERVGYDAAMGTVEFDELVQSKVPLIVGLTQRLGMKQVEFRHFVVYRGFDGDWVYLADPIRGNIRKTGPEFLSQWQKKAVLVVAKPNTDPKTVSPLMVRPSETYLGELSMLQARKALSRPVLSVPFPMFGR